MPNDPRVTEILRLIDRLFGDTSVSQEITLAMMEDIEERAREYVEAVKADIKHR